MPIFAAQYLADLPAGATAADVRQRLRDAFRRLPISMVLLGWNLPPEFEQAVADESDRQQARLYRWQPWLTADSQTDLPSEWATIGLTSAPIPGYNAAPDFTFVCPNRSGVAEFLSERLESIAARGLYHGLFLDRIRFPSPSCDPAVHLGCFCSHCARLAADAGLDLELVRRYLQSLLSDADGARKLVRGLLVHRPVAPDTPLDAFLDFREQSITRLIQATKKQAGELSLSIGLDCFSPSLTRMVAQDLPALDKNCDWIKLMIYPRVYGPAGISFELYGLAYWLVRHYGLSELEAAQYLAEASGLTVPTSLPELRRAGLGSGTLTTEIQRGRKVGVTSLLAGVALVEVKGVHESTPEQIHADMLACLQADGLVISWDLWQTPLEYLDSIRTYWEKQL